jgi:thymidine phosphorylase
MKEEKDAVFLAELMVETGERMGKSMVALITNMDQPLGLKVGNALEVVECIEVLRGQGPADLRELCLELAAWMFHLGGAAPNVERGKADAARILDSGKALERFRQMVELQGGDVTTIDDPTGLPRTQQTQVVKSPKSGYITEMNCEAVGTACVVLGGGREKKEDSVDSSVGIVLHHKVGDQIAAGEPLCTIHFNSGAKAATAAQLLLDSYQIGDTPPVKKALVHRVIRNSQSAAKLPGGN